MKLNTIYNEDCLLGMNKIHDKTINLIFSDLPFGITKNKWDSIIPLDKLWDQYNRIIKDNGTVLLFACSRFIFNLYNSNPKNYKYEWIIEYTQPRGFLNAKKRPLNCHDFICVFYKKHPYYNPIITDGHNKKSVPKNNISKNYNEYNSVPYCSTKRYPRSILKFSKPTHPIHPTQKPLELCEYMLKTYTKKCDLVLDNCIGSGTMAIACLNTNRNYIGFENNKNYYETALNRIDIWKSIQNDLRRI